MELFSSDHLDFPRPPGHRFPLEKYRLLREGLIAEGLAAPEQIRAAPPALRADLERAHDPEWVSAVLAGTLDAAQVRRIGFPWSPEYRARTLASVGGTLAAARRARECGFAANLAGGTHHAHRDFGSGYCTFNDLAVAALDALDDPAIERVAILDLDVHQGDGTAAIFAEDPRVFTCSVHGARNFPRLKPLSDLDLALPDGAGDTAFLEAVRRALHAVIDQGRPDFLLYQAGVDALEADRLGRLSVSLEGLEARDRMVFEETKRRGLPLAATIGGGYAEPVELTVAAHLGTFRAAASSRG
jgi:acetoin utilization deacetylase AcuC-like enzyme